MYRQKLECINPASSLLGVTGKFVNCLQEHLIRCLCDFSISQSLKSYHFPQLLLECWCSESSGSRPEQMTALLADCLGFVYQAYGVSCADISSVIWGVTGWTKPHMNFFVWNTFTPTVTSAEICAMFKAQDECEEFYCYFKLTKSRSEANCH